MAVDGDDSVQRLSPDDAFTALGNEIRMGILRTLSQAQTPMSFTELRTQVGMRDPGHFQYHLKQLLGHFIDQTDDGYTLLRAGEQVIMAVLSGVVTDDPEFGPTPTDLTCWYCGGMIEVSYCQERATAHCSQCLGVYGDSIKSGERTRLGYMYLPPAGIEGRTPAEVYLAALTWRSRDILAWGNRICPHCSAPLENNVQFCDEHDPSHGLCELCDRRYGVEFHTRCSNCIFEMNAMFAVYLLANTELREFLLRHGFDSFAPTPDQYAALFPYDENVLSTDPFNAQFTFTIDDSAITLEVDENLHVVKLYENNKLRGASGKSNQ